MICRGIFQEFSSHASWARVQHFEVPPAGALASLATRPPSQWNSFHARRIPLGVRGVNNRAPPPCLRPFSFSVGNYLCVLVFSVFGSIRRVIPWLLPFLPALILPGL
ncbi:unnamed protein product [Ectocarpus sp. 12 AP-2014]